MLRRIGSPDLRVYVVWLPVLPLGGWDGAAARETRRIPDSRAVHYFDAAAQLAKLYSHVLQLRGDPPAYDIYMAFASNVRWPGVPQGGAPPPAPTYWMHQLGRAAPPELFLNAEQFARAVNGLLGALPASRPVGRLEPNRRRLPSRHSPRPLIRLAVP